MANHALKGLLGGLVAGSLMLSSTAYAAPATAPIPQANPWALLSAMSGGAPAAAMCGAAAAAAAAQAPTGCVLPALDVAPAPATPVPAAPPIPPISGPAAGGLGVSPLLLGLLAIAAGVGIYFAVHHHGNNSNSPA
jgi:hypothetical protein